MGKGDGKKNTIAIFFFLRASIKRRQFSREQREMSLKALAGGTGTFVGMRGSSQGRFKTKRRHSGTSIADAVTFRFHISPFL